MKLVGLFLLLAFTFAFGLQLRAQSQPLLQPALKEGDIIGESEIIADPTTSYIEAATQSRFGHVGVVLTVQGQLMIYEEYPPAAQVVSVATFLNRAPGTYAVLRKAVAPTSSELALIHSAGDQLVQQNEPYNYSQVKNATSMNCSEFLNHIFAAAGVSVGRVQTIGDMNLKTFHGVPWKLWQQSSPSISTTDQVLSPKSVMQTSGWSVVAGSLDPQAILSDRDLFLQWQSVGATAGVAQAWGVTETQLDQLSQP